MVCPTSRFNRLLVRSAYESIDERRLALLRVLSGR
jgi:hypothetical protein